MLKTNHHKTVGPFSICQGWRVHQVSQEDLDVQGWTVPKEREEILVSEACQGLKVNPLFYAFTQFSLLGTNDCWAPGSDLFLFRIFSVSSNLILTKARLIWTPPTSSLMVKHPRQRFYQMHPTFRVPWSQRRLWTSWHSGSEFWRGQWKGRCPRYSWSQGSPRRGPGCHARITRTQRFAWNPGRQGLSRHTRRTRTVWWVCDGKIFRPLCGLHRSQ